MSNADQPRESRPGRGSAIPLPPPHETLARHYTRRTLSMLDHFGEVCLLTQRTFRMAFKRPFEGTAILHQMDSLGVKSMGIVATTSIFIGMVMTIQFAYGLSRFGGVEYIPRVVLLSFARELAPTLTAVIVGGRIGSGMAAEVGSMNVTEQVDAIRALGADPAKKLVLPRVVAAMTVMPILSTYALILGTFGAILICDLQFGIAPEFFVRSALESTTLGDFWSGIAKTPVFGFLIAMIGCHFGLRTTGGTEGVGTSTTRTVVVVSIAILVADFLLTKLFIAFGGVRVKRQHVGVALILVLPLGIAAMGAHAAHLRAARAADQPAIEAVARLLPANDLALAGGARWLRFPSLEEPGAAFQDGPALPDPDPAGGTMAPPIAVWQAEGR